MARKPSRPVFMPATGMPVERTLIAVSRKVPSPPTLIIKVYVIRQFGDLTRRE
ncbi:MAG: hypothetical protein MZV63_54690 [Marinilabiliales bacterium]|nr:hypothetical protein [Marinilabiliales bacterium]